jgi:hypothetical protein
METTQPEIKERPPKQQEQPLEKVRPDLNLEKWSLWQPAKSKLPPKEKVLRREIELPNGNKVLAEVEVGFTNKGALTTEDQKTFYALLKIWEEKGRGNDAVFYSLRHLAKILKKHWGTNVIDATSQSLLRLRITPLIWKNSYQDSTQKDYVEILDPFSILSDLKVIRRKTDGHITQEFGYFKFNDFIVKNLLNNHTKPVLLDTVLGFQSEIAQLLYTHLDLIMARRDHYERKTLELFFDDLGLTGKAYQNPSDRKRTLERAIRELEGARLSTGYIAAITLERTRDGKDYKLVVDKKSSQPLRQLPMTTTDTDAREILPVTPHTPPTCEQEARSLVNYFHKLFHGVESAHPGSKALNQATALVAQHGYERARFVVDFAHTEATKTKYSPQTFGGILNYVSRALAARDTFLAKEKARVAAAQCLLCNDSGFLSLEDERRYTFALRCPHDLAALHTTALAHDWQHHTFADGMLRGTRVLDAR